MEQGKRFAWAIEINLVLLSAFYHYHPIAHELDMQLTSGQTPYSRVPAWRELGAEVSKARTAYPDAVLLSNSRKYLV